MIPLAALALAGPFAAKDVGLSWSFPGTVRAAAGHVDLLGKELRGEIHWYKGAWYTAEALAKDDALRTKEADASKRFTHTVAPTTFAGMPATLSDQRYLWDGVPITSRCVYCVQGSRGWVVRLWWPRTSATGLAAAVSFLTTVKRLK